MKVLLVATNSERMNMTTLPLGAGCVVAATRAAGHEVLLCDLQADDDLSHLVTTLREFAPHVVGLSVRNLDNQDMHAPQLLLTRVREVVALLSATWQGPLVVGGAGFSVCPDPVLDYLGVDLGIQGEGEAAFPELLRRLESGEPLQGIAGLHVRNQEGVGKRAFVADLDSLPLPEPSLWEPAYRTDPTLWMPFQTRRGCALDCSYCATGLIEGRTLRQRVPQHVVNSLAEYAEAGFRRFYFTDNTFNLPRSYAMRLCQELIARNLCLTWRAIVHPMGVDPELARMMAQAGCIEVSLGFEHGAPSMLQALGKRFTPEDIRGAVQAFVSAGVKRHGFLLLGGPGETRETVEEALALADTLNLDHLKVTIGIRLYPGTALARTAIADGTLGEDDDLLLPRFYLAETVRPWIHQRVREWAATRPHVIHPAS